MSEKRSINTGEAPQAIGPYSQAIKVHSMVFISGQIPLVPETMELVGDDLAKQTHQVFKNLRSVAKASGGDLNDIVKLTIYLTDLSAFSIVNEIMASYFVEPYPARATIEVSSLPKSASIEVDAILTLGLK
ncbi:MAG: reactive intermediate/imine deaminase [Gammaproteobacteria bacterium]|nr:reactive intermediate/imine deaminase [Gammaproteobacteria bacterium]|tara:strand:- start:5069 stop:5461 length:393 start_codon:yes stop_codon:yes gene_type:complete